MYTTESNPANIPPNLPVIDSPPAEPGWRSVGTNELIRTYHQVYRLTPRVGWQITAFFTKDGYVNQGRTYFRAPVSVGAWMEVLKALPGKYWRRFKREI